MTLSLLVVHDGKIVHERYAPGVDMSTRTRTWSTAKSIAATLIGMLVDEGKMALDKPLGVNWLPRASAQERDPRRAITLRHVLNMSSGLETVDNGGLEYATGSGMSYWAGASSVTGAVSRGAIREPGTSWDYENYDALLAVNAMKLAIGNDQEYLQFPRKALLDRIGMRNTVVSTDRFGDFILSSQVYTNARDLARLGLLYLQGGMWQGERLLSEDWIKFVRTPAPATAQTWQSVRRSLVARPGQPNRRTKRRVLDRRQPRPVRHRRSLARFSDRTAWNLLRPARFRPLGFDA